MAMQSIEDIARWFRAKEHSLKWFTQMVKRDLDLEGFFSHRFVVLTKHPSEEGPSSLDFESFQQEEPLEKRAREWIFGEEELVLIRDQQRDVFLEPAVDIRFEEAGEAW